MTTTAELPVKKDKGYWKLILKLLVTGICIWYISHKINFSQFAGTFQLLNPVWLVLALLCFLFSKLLSAFRINIYFRQIALQLSEWTNIKLYWLGMFFNLFLPGSISGDAYKVVRLTKTYGVSYKRTTAAVLLDRFSGLAGLGLLTGALWLLLFKHHPLNGWMIAGMVLLVPVFYLSVKFLFPYLLPAFWSTFAWGVAVQVFQVVTFYCILQALGIHQQLPEYALIFLVASVVAVLPFTIGGLGAREMVFLWGAHLFHLDNTSAVMASALFYLTTVVASSFGGYFVFADPLKTATAEK
jgi:glycosyltransferase 2 family protein